MGKRILVGKCMKCGTEQGPIYENGYGYQACDPCAEVHDKQVLDEWADFCKTVAEFENLHAEIERMEKERNGNNIN